MKKASAAFILLVLVCSQQAFAAHPLITDDAGTQGKGNMQFEFLGEYGKDRNEWVTEQNYKMPTVPVFSFGITDKIDIVFGLPYISVRTEAAGGTTVVRGIGDATIEVKARFYEKDGFSLALKPGINLPTGKEEKGLGNGKLSYTALFIGTKEVEPWAFHVNVGYARNEYSLAADEDANRNDLWQFSLATQVMIAKGLDLVANIGMERNPDRKSNRSPAFALAGFIYSVSDMLDLDMGIKTGLNREEADFSVLTGITWRI